MASVLDTLLPEVNILDACRLQVGRFELAKLQILKAGVNGNRSLVALTALLLFCRLGLRHLARRVPRCAGVASGALC